MLGLRLLQQALARAKAIASFAFSLPRHNLAPGNAAKYLSLGRPVIDLIGIVDAYGKL